jgi:hypothetical protein
MMCRRGGGGRRRGNEAGGGERARRPRATGSWILAIVFASVAAAVADNTADTLPSYCGCGNLRHSDVLCVVLESAVSTISLPKRQIKSSRHENTMKGKREICRETQLCANLH